jgi:ADP-heptose:LPS heptosyltransferase
MSISLANIRYPVVFHVNGYGDRLMGLPTIRALSSLFGGRLQIVGAIDDGELFYQGLELDSIVEMRYSWQGERCFDDAALAECLTDCDLFISLNTWSSSSLNKLLKKLDSAMTIGLDENFQIQLPYLPTEHYIDSVFRSVQYLDPTLTPEKFVGPPIRSAVESSIAGRFQQSRQPFQRVLAVHTQTEVAKMWPLDRFASVLSSFLNLHPEYLVIILDPEPTELKDLLDRERVSFFVDRSLAEIFALVGIADLFLGIDSCLLHAADLAGIPGIGLFAHTNPQKFGFRFAPHYHIIDRSMAEIDSARVLNLLLELAEDLGALEAV